MFPAEGYILKHKPREAPSHQASKLINTPFRTLGQSNTIDRNSADSAEKGPENDKEGWGVGIRNPTFAKPFWRQREVERELGTDGKRI